MGRNVQRSFWIIVFIGTVGLTSPVRAGEPKRTVVFLTADTLSSVPHRLSTAISAHLSDFDATVEVSTYPAVLPADPSPHETASQLIQEPHVLSVVWIEPSVNEIVLLIADRGQVKKLVRPLPPQVEGEPLPVDAVGSLVRAALMPWFDDEPESGPTESVPPQSDKTLSEPPPL